MSEIESFRDLDAWKVSMELVVLIYALVTKLPPSERFELSRQIRRAAVSIPANIAEGQGYGPGLRYLNHVRIALGSLAELETELELAQRLKYLAPQDLDSVSEHLVRTGQLLHGLRRSLVAKTLKSAGAIATGVVLALALLTRL